MPCDPKTSPAGPHHLLDLLEEAEQPDVETLAQEEEEGTL